MKEIVTLASNYKYLLGLLNDQYVKIICRYRYLVLWRMDIKLVRIRLILQYFMIHQIQFTQAIENEMGLQGAENRVAKGLKFQATVLAMI